MLKQKGMTDTFFVQTNKVASWTDVVNAKNDGFEIANHTKIHPSLATLSEQEMIDGISGVKQLIAANGMNAITLDYTTGSGGKDATNVQNVRIIT